MSNMDLWHRVCKTDPAHVKPITGKDYSGNSPKPYWIVQRLTEEFGPCGIGWGFTVLNERFERFSDTDTLHVALVEFWYVLGDKRGELQQVGQTKSSYVTSKGVFKVDEDAPKKSVTDALVKCASYLGFAGDIFSGRWDDSKYVIELRREFADAAKQATDDLRKAIEGAGKPMDSAGLGMDDKRKAELEELALDMIASHRNGKDLAAIGAYYFLNDNEDKLYVWKCLAAESKLRGIIKANRPVGAAKA